MASSIVTIWKFEQNVVCFFLDPVMAHAGSIFYSILPIKKTPAEVMVMVDLLRNETTYPVGDGNLAFNKLFIDGTTLLGRKEEVQGYFQASIKVEQKI